MLDACGIDSDPLFVLGRDRVEETEALNEPSPTPAAAVRDDHVIEGPALRARSGESNFHHDSKCFLSRREDDRWALNASAGV